MKNLLEGHHLRDQIHIYNDMYRNPIMLGPHIFASKPVVSVKISNNLYASSRFLRIIDIFNKLNDTAVSFFGFWFIHDRNLSYTKGFNINSTKITYAKNFNTLDDSCF